MFRRNIWLTRTWDSAKTPNNQRRREIHMHPLNTVKGAITTGFVLAVIIGILLSVWGGLGVAFHPVRIDRWLHIVSGVMWIGLLYYFNVVQTPGLGGAAPPPGAAPRGAGRR